MFLNIVLDCFNMQFHDALLTFLTLQDCYILTVVLEKILCQYGRAVGVSAYTEVLHPVAFLRHASVSLQSESFRLVVEQLCESFAPAAGIGRHKAAPTSRIHPLSPVSCSIVVKRDKNDILRSILSAYGIRPATAFCDTDIMLFCYYTCGVYPLFCKGFLQALRHVTRPVVLTVSAIRRAFAWCVRSVSVVNQYYYHLAVCFVPQRGSYESPS